MNFVVSFIFLELLAIAAINIRFCNGSAYVGCIESEREALLKFKQDLDDPSNRLASWTRDNGDCCNWACVVCDNFTGHVLELRLVNPVYDYGSSEDYRRSRLVGKINHSLLDFKHLIHLDLSGNDFQGSQIPQYLGFMENLRYLNFSNAGFSGMIPHQLGNLSSLLYLDLSNDVYATSLYVENLWWLSRLSLLKHLDLTYVDLSKASDWVLVISSIPSLKVLKLSDCQLHVFPQLSLANFSTLTALDLSYNLFDSSLIPNWVFGLSHLVFLDLSANKFQGGIPDGLGNLTFLRHLDLSNNQFNFTIPDWIFRFSGLEYLSLGGNMLEGTISSGLGNLTSLKTLNLSYNVLEGKIPTSFGRLCKLSSIDLSSANTSQELSDIFNIFSRCISDGLEVLDLSRCQIFGHLTDQIGKFKNLKYFSLGHNFITGNVSETHFAYLSNLSSLDLHQNSITFNVGLDWIPPFQVFKLRLDSCYHLGNRFPSWILSQKLLQYLSISNSSIQDTLPDGFWEFSSQLSIAHLSHNRIHGKIPNSPKATRLHILYLNSNNLSGPLPLISSNELIAIDLSNNSLSGSISHLFCHGLKESNGMQTLNLGGNLLSGEIPDCWMNIPSLKLLNLGNNKFTGNIPPSIGTLSSLLSLDLSKNKLSGTIPESLKNCTALQSLKFGDNKLLGNVPMWIGERFSGMLILSLRSNKFDGPFPAEICLLRSLQILDLADNNLSGAIPTCLSNLSAMVKMNYSASNNISYVVNYTYYIEVALVTMKGNVVEYITTLNLVRTIDLSENNFSGEIPTEVTDLEALRSLNLSHNHFSGKIPMNIGALRLLESIDFSNNKISGNIPQSMSSLTFLSHLNLSNNNLTGKIPLSTQLQSLDAAFFAGNDLCGAPLPSCAAEMNDPGGNENKDEDENEVGVDWGLYVSLALGFVVGLWCFIGPLIINRRWRYRYCHFLDGLVDKFGCFVRKCHWTGCLFFFFFFF